MAEERAPQRPLEHLEVLGHRIENLFDELTSRAQEAPGQPLELTGARIDALKDLRVALAGARGSAMAWGNSLVGLNSIAELVDRVQADLGAGIDPAAADLGVFRTTLGAAVDAIRREWSHPGGVASEGSEGGASEWAEPGVLPSEHLMGASWELGQLLRGIEHDDRQELDEPVELTDERRRALDEIDASLAAAWEGAVGLGAPGEPVEELVRRVLALRDDLAAGIWPDDSIAIGSYRDSIEQTILQVAAAWDPVERAARDGAPGPDPADRPAGASLERGDHVVLTIPARDPQANETRVTISRERGSDWHGIPAYGFVVVEAAPGGDRVVFDDKVHGPVAGAEPELVAMAFVALSFVTMRPGDVEESYFDHYGADALAWRDRYAGDLAGIAADYDTLRLDGLADADALREVSARHGLGWSTGTATGTPMSPRERLNQAAAQLGQPRAGGTAARWRPAGNTPSSGHAP